MADKQKSRILSAFAQFADEVGEVIVELAGIGDVAARPRGAVAAEIDPDRRNSDIGERARNAVHLGRGAAEP